MGSNFVQEEGNHIVSIPEVINMEQLAQDMKEEIERCTKGLRRNAARSSCSIYKVPLRFEKNNGPWYSPRIVSIGPYHYYDKDLNRDYKYRCLGSFQSRTQVKGVGLEDYLEKLRPREFEARQCYSREIDLNNSGEFLEMMVVDASFILELFYKFQDPGLLETDDPLALLKWRLPYFYEDLLLLENQIPFFVLQDLFDISKLPVDPPLSLLALRFFNNIMRRTNEVIERYANLKNQPLHLLDLVRSSLIPNDIPMPPKNENDTHIPFIPCFPRFGQNVDDAQVPLILPRLRRLGQKDNDTQIQSFPCISKLRRSGIKVSPGKTDSFLAVKFEHGLIEMPSITINDFMRYLLLNCVAFEQCHNSCSNHVTAYVTFLDCLVNTSADVEYLRERNVVDNYVADDDKVALFINSLGKDVNFDIRHFYLSKLFNDVDKYYRNNRRVCWASFKRRYFNTRWWFISALIATLLLLLTIAQTYFDIIG